MVATSGTEKVDIYSYKFPCDIQVYYRTSDNTVIGIESSDMGKLNVGEHDVVKMSLTDKNILIHMKAGSRLKFN